MLARIRAETGASRETQVTVAQLVKLIRWREVHRERFRRADRVVCGQIADLGDALIGSGELGAGEFSRLVAPDAVTHPQSGTTFRGTWRTRKTNGPPNLGPHGFGPEH